MVKKTREPKRITRYSHEGIVDPRTPETGHTPLLPDQELTVSIPMDNGWVGGMKLAEIPGEETERVLVDMDPLVDPALFWAGKRNRRDLSILPLQRNEVVAESRIARIIERARRESSEPTSDAEQGVLFADLEKTLREGDKNRRVEFYTHDEGWRNKLISGDSLAVMESLLHYEQLQGKVQMIYVDPPYGVQYDSNFQQRVDSTKNDGKDRADDVLAIKAYNDTWALGIHSYLSYLQERLYLCRELLGESGSIFVQMGEDHVHLVRALMDEVFGKANYISEIDFYKTSGKGGGGLDAVYDTLLWYAKAKPSMKYRELYVSRADHTLVEQYTLLELPGGAVRSLTDAERRGLEPLPIGARRFKPADISSQGKSAGGSKPVDFGGRPYELPPNTHWKTSAAGMRRLAEIGRLHPIGKRLTYKRFADDFPLTTYTNIWDDTIISGFAAPKLYAVQTSPKVIERCVLMTTDPGDLVMDPTCGSGTTAYCAEKFGRRWITCDTSRVASNVARQRLLASVFDHYRTRNGTPASGFFYRAVDHVTLKSLAYDLEPEKIDLVDQPESDPTALRVTGPFEVLTLGRYSLDDWKGVVSDGTPDSSRMENYIGVIVRLYRRDAGLSPSTGTVHAVVESPEESLGISVGPISGRVTARQIYEAARDAANSGLSEVHILGWAFEANVGEVRAETQADSNVRVELVMIRPDSLAEGLKVTRPETLFSPMALPDLEVVDSGEGRVAIVLRGIAVYNRSRRTTDYSAADAGYVSAWYLDEDYDGDCFVDCQMFFDFKRKPALERTLGIEIDADEWRLKQVSEPFLPGKYRRVAVKVVDVFGNESTAIAAL
jgi:adenine-specific DNA-methyltransferase